MSFGKSGLRIAAAFTLLVSLLLLGASAAAKDPVVLRVLYYFDATSPGAQREITEVWEAFDKANPDIKIVREDLFNEPFHQKTEIYAATGQLPDVIYMWPGGRSTTLHTKKLVKISLRSSEQPDPSSLRQRWCLRPAATWPSSQ